MVINDDDEEEDLLLPGYCLYMDNTARKSISSLSQRSY